jgi:ABC-2 type transport system permease protein
MKSFTAALWAEGLKIRKSKVFWLTLAFFAFIPCMMSLILVVQKYPDLASKLGMIGTKATMMQFGEASWKSFFLLINQGIAAIGLVGYGFITSWVFGREYTDNTLKDLLALPASRSNIVAAKFSIVIIWCLIVTTIFLLVAMLCGTLTQIPGWSGETISSCISVFVLVALMSILLSTPVAFFACYSKGYFLPLGIVILTLILANFTGVVGLGPYFPWAVPGIYSTMGSAEGLNLSAASYVILFSTSIAGLLGTLAWFRFADQK